ncbi:MAG: TetR/AcrR family transcriptional regulator [Candidatus Aegiribacteria sp.]
MEKVMDTGRRIMDAAARLIGSDGAVAITTRRIAEEADVNPAALNYHFGSKERLIDLALKESMESLFDDWERILAIDGMPLPVRIYSMLDYTMERVTESPGIVGSHLFDPLVSRDRRVAFAGAIGEFLRTLPADLEEDLPLQAKDIRLYLGQVVLLTVTAALIPELFRAMTEEDISSGPARSRFITGTMKRFLRIELNASDIIHSDIARVRELTFNHRGRT